jgi:prepilin-type N-terminal cleavage/methylation domain-containing protein
MEKLLAMRRPRSSVYITNHSGRSFFKRSMGRAWKLLRRGFTLLELLVVAAIITILASILLPSLRSVLGRQRQICCINNQKQLGYATIMYAGDYNDYYPAGLAGGGAGTAYTWIDQLSVYCTQYKDITAAHAVQPSGINSPSAKTFSPFICPAKDSIWADKNPAQATWVGNYTINSNIFYDYTCVDNNICPKRLNSLSRPSECGLLWDGINAVLAYSSYNTSTKANLLLPDGDSGTPDYRHNKNINILFAEGHSASAAVQPVLPIAYKGSWQLWL